MARKKQNDAKAKAAKQKKLAIGLVVVFVAVLAFEVPKTLKLMHGQQAAPPPAPAATTTTDASSTPASAGLAAPTLAGSPTTETSTTATSLVSAVPVSPDPGQLEQFERFATKDPFVVQAGPGSASSSPSPRSGSGKSGGSPAGPPPATPPTPPAPPPTNAVIELDGQKLLVPSGTDFPTSGPVFDQLHGPLFHLDSLTQQTAKVSIIGGSYADGSGSLTLTVGKLVTLQNTADGSRYTLKLDPQGTKPASDGSGSQGGATTVTTPAAPTTTTSPTSTTSATTSIVP